MKLQPYSRRKRTTTESVLRLPDLEHAEAASIEQSHQLGFPHFSPFKFLGGAKNFTTIVRGPAVGCTAGLRSPLRLGRRAQAVARTFPQVRQLPPTTAY